MNIIKALLISIVVIIALGSVLVVLCSMKVASDFDKMCEEDMEGSPDE